MRIVVLLLTGMMCLAAVSEAVANDKCEGCARDSRGRILRSAAAKNEFKRETGHPGHREGYVVDHKIPLACGGADDPSNMQWQRIAAAKKKDRVERKDCH